MFGKSLRHSMALFALVISSATAFGQVDRAAGDFNQASLQMSQIPRDLNPDLVTFGALSLVAWIFALLVYLFLHSSGRDRYFAMAQGEKPPQPKYLFLRQSSAVVSICGGCLLFFFALLQGPEFNAAIDLVGGGLIPWRYFNLTVVALGLAAYWAGKKVIPSEVTVKESALGSDKLTFFDKLTYWVLRSPIAVFALVPLWPGLENQPKRVIIVSQAIVASFAVVGPTLYKLGNSKKHRPLESPGSEAETTRLQAIAESAAEMVGRWPDQVRVLAGSRAIFLSPRFVTQSAILEMPSGLMDRCDDRELKVIVMILLTKQLSVTRRVWTTLGLVLAFMCLYIPVLNFLEKELGHPPLFIYFFLGIPVIQLEKLSQDIATKRADAFVAQLTNDPAS